MADVISEDISLSLPDPANLAASVAGGVMNPLLKESIDIDLPQPPPRYPVGVSSTNMIPTQTDASKGSNSIMEDINNSLETANQWARNPYQYGKLKTYNADYDGANFARYAAVPRVFKEQGFSLYRDNEELYNENATWWDYFKRSAGASWQLFKTGFTDMLPWNAWDGKSSDLVAAKEMEKWHAIGADSRSGIGSFMNNMTVDSGYTFGILAEFAAEEIALWGATVLSGGATGGAAWTRTVKKIDDVKDALSIEGLRSKVNKAYDWMKSPEKMKDIYNYAKGTLKSVGKTIIPQTGSFIANDIIAAGKKGDLVFDMAKASKGFGAFYRDSRAVAAVLSEASLEGGSAELQVRDQLIDGFYEKNGFLPNDKQMEAIYSEAANAGRETYLWNLPALYISNQIVFETALKGFKPAAVFREELKTGLAGRLTFNEAWKKAGVKAWSTVEESALQSFKNVFNPATYKPKNLLKNTVGKFALYTKENLAEGLQEVYQDAVQKTMVDYYSARFTHPALAGSRSMWGDFAKNIGNPNLETFASGFLMGSMVQIPQKFAFNYLPKQFYKLTNRAEYDQHMAQQQDHTNKVVDALNYFTMDEKYYNSTNENAVVQLNGNAEAQQANMVGDKKAFGDITDETEGNHFMTLLESGKLGILVDQFKDLKSLNKEALEEAFGPVDKSVAEDSYTHYQKKLDNMIKKSEKLKELYEVGEREIGDGPFNPNTVDKKKDPELYKSIMEGALAWKMAKRDFVLQNYSFYRTLQRVDSLTNNLTSNSELAKTAASDLMLATSPQLMTDEIAIVKGSLDAYKTFEKDPANKSKIESLQERLEYLEELQSAVEGITVAQKLEPSRELGTQLKEIEDADKAARIDEGTVVKNKKGNEHKVAYVKRGFAYNSKGEKIGKIKDLDIISQPEGKIEKDAMTYATERLFNAYSQWMKYSAKVNNNDNVTDRAIEKSFADYRDIYLLKQDAKFLGETIQTLLDPNKFKLYTERLRNVIGDINKSRETLLRNSYERFLRIKKMNELFNQLYEMKVFLDEKGMQDVLNNRVPSIFFNIPKSKDSITPVPFNSEKYRQILDLFEKYEQTSGKKFKDKPITEAIPFVEETAGYNIENREKGEDKRTLAEHAAYWGFDPEMKTMSSIKTLDVLKKIVDSPYSTYKEKALARRLLTIVKANSEIKFEKLSRPNKALYTDEGKMGMSVDPRYSSSDFGITKNYSLPIEAVILNTVIKDITAYDMSKNLAFKNDIAKLFEAAKEEFKKNKPANATLFGDKAGLEFYGLRNQEDFVAEALTNDRFATWLKTIDYQTTGKSAWQELLDMLSQFFAKILGISKDNTLLDEVVYVVTKHIDKIEGVTEDSLAQEARYKAATQAGTNVPGGISKDSTINELAASGVLKELVADYIRINKERQVVAPDSVYDPLYDQRPESELIETEGFKKYLQSTSASNIISAHNRKKGTVTTSTTITTTTTTPVSTDAQAEIEAEKVVITESEFTELKRLAKFFLDNPKEPTVVGSVVAKYPALFKAITDIERGRQEKLDRETPIKNENITVDFGGNISVTYQVITYKDGSIKISTTNKTSKKYNKLSDEVFKDYEKIDFESDAKGIIKTELIKDDYNDKQSQEIKEAKEKTINAEYDAKLAALEKAPVTNVDTTPVNKKTKERLLAKGYNYSDIDSMNQQQAEALLVEGYTKKEKLEAIAAEEEQQKQIKREKELLTKVELMASIIKDINGAKYLSDLIDVQNRVSDIINRNPGVLDTDAITKGIESKKKSLSANITFDSMIVKDHIQLDNDQIVKVIEINNNSIVVQTMGKIEDGASQVEFPISKKQFDKNQREPNKRYVMYKVQPGMEEVTGIPVTSQEDVESTKENVTNSKIVVSDEDLQGELEDAKSQKIVDLEKDFLDNLDQCLPGNQLSIF